MWYMANGLGNPLGGAGSFNLINLDKNCLIFIITSNLSINIFWELKSTCKKTNMYLNQD